MRQPSTCPECDELVELTNMLPTYNKLCYHSFVCEDCYANLESDEED